MVGQQQIAIAEIEDVPPTPVMQQNVMTVWLSPVFMFGKIENANAIIQTGHPLDRLS